MKTTNNEKTTEELQEIISWYAERVYDMTDAINEIEWLIDNLKPKAFQQIVDFYEDYNKNLKFLL